MAKTIVAGVEDFKAIIDNNYFYIGKTLLIKHILDDGSIANIITIPRRFGKTLSLKKSLLKVLSCITFL